MKLRMGILFFLIGLANSSFSQGETGKKWTLKECIEYANRNSITALSGGLNVANMEINYRQSKLNLLPTVNGSGSHNYNYGRTVDPITNSYVSQQIQSNSFGLSAGVNVFSGLQARSNVSAQRYNYMASQKEMEVTLNSVALSISNFYLQIIQSREIVKVAQEQLLSSMLQLENTKKLIDAGSRPGGDLYSIEAQVATDELAVQNAENTLELAVLNLKNTLNLGLDTYFDVEDPKDIFMNNINIDTTGNVKEVYTDNVEKRPEVQAAEYRRNASNFMLKGAKGGLSPQVTLFGNLNTRYSENGVSYINPQVNRFMIGEVDGTGEKVYGYNTSFETEKTTFGDQLQDNLGRSIGLSMSIPLFNGLTNQNNIKLAKLNLEQANLQVREQENKYLADLTQASTNYRSSIKRLSSSKKNRDAQELNYDYSEKRFNAGAMDFMTFSIAKNNYNIAQAQYIQAKYEYVFTGLVLNFYKGLPIEIE